MDERVPPPAEDAPEGTEDTEDPLEEPAGADDLLEPEPAGEAGALDRDEEGQPRPRRKSAPAPELTIEEQRRRLEEETGERDSVRRRRTRRPPGDYQHFG